MTQTLETRQIERVARCFDPKGRLLRWPSKRGDQLLVLWVIWSFFPDDRQMSEMDVNAILRGWHDYEDFALLRRELCDLDLLRRTPNGKVYRKIGQAIPDEVVPLLARFASLLRGLP